jgi:arsenite methyltransferase
MELAMKTQDIEIAVKKKYGQAARSAQNESKACCGPSCCSGNDPITSDLYDRQQIDAVPEKAFAASLGCGNPTALADLHDGDTVLDLGSGGGIDVFLAAQRVGAQGKVYGLDMTDEMLALARDNQRKAGVQNVEFLKGDIQQVPLPDASVDVIVSNCVINLAADKDRTLREAFRVLKPGGQFAVSDVVVLGPVPEVVRRNMDLWVGCIAGALEQDDYVSKLSAAGFADISIEPWRVYQPSEAREFLMDAGLDEPAIVGTEGTFASAFIRARKPMNASRQA